MNAEIIELDGEEHTLVLTICSFRGLDDGWSAAPTRAMSEVQKSISTIPRAPSSISPESTFQEPNETWTDALIV